MGIANRRFHRGYFDFGEIPAPCNGKGRVQQILFCAAYDIPCHARLCIRTGNENIVIGTRFDCCTKDVRDSGRFIISVPIHTDIIMVRSP